MGYAPWLLSILKQVASNYHLLPLCGVISKLPREKGETIS